MGLWDTLEKTLNALLEEEHALSVEEQTILVRNVKRKQPNLPFKLRRGGKTKDRNNKKEAVRYVESEGDGDETLLPHHLRK